MNNEILKIQNDLFFLPKKKKNVPENRHEKRLELPNYLKYVLDMYEIFRDASARDSMREWGEREPSDENELLWPVSVPLDICRIT